MQQIDKLCRELQRIARKRFNFASYDRRRMFAPHVVLELAPLGMFGLGVSKAQGGAQLSFVEMMVVEQQLAAIDVTLAAFLGIHNALGVHPINVHGTKVQKVALERYARGQALLGFALTEPSAGSDPTAILTTAKPCGSDRWQLYGEKIWIGNAGWAQALLVICRVLTDNQERGEFAAFLVPTDREGIEIGSECETLGLRGIVQNKVTLCGVSVTSRDMLGQLGQGMEVAQTAMQLGRLGIGAIGIGAMKRVLQLSLTFAQHRRIGAKALIERLSVRRLLGDCEAEIAFFETILKLLARTMDKGHRLPDFFAPALKIAVSERAWKWADAALQLSGGRGYDEANHLARILRDVRILRIFEGPTEALQAYLGSTTLFAFRSIKDGIQAISETSKAGADAIREIEEKRTQALSWLKSAEGGMSRPYIEAVGLGLGQFVCWRLNSLLFVIAEAGEVPQSIKRLLADSEMAWYDFVAPVQEDYKDWEPSASERKLLDEIGGMKSLATLEYMGEDTLLYPTEP